MELNKDKIAQFSCFWGVGIGYFNDTIHHNFKDCKRTYEIRKFIFLCFEYEICTYVKETKN